MKERVLVIKLGALGDLVLCASVFAAIRAHHPDAPMALLTAPPFASLALQMPWFNTVILDPRPKLTQPLKWLQLIRQVRTFKPTRVYDLQGKTRQKILYHALGKPLWSGAIKGCSNPRPWPPVQGMHYTDFIAAQIMAAGLDAPQPPDMSWLDGDVAGLDLPERFAVLITGCSPQHPHKMWPAVSYAALADRLKQEGLAVLAIGTKDDAPRVEAVRSLAPHVIDLTGKTSLGQVAALCRRATLVVGNDTGPTHIAAAVGAKTMALMSEKVDPLWSCPKGPNAQWLGGRPLDEVSVDEVLCACTGVG